MGPLQSAGSPQGQEDSSHTSGLHSNVLLLSLPHRFPLLVLSYRILGRAYVCEISFYYQESVHFILPLSFILLLLYCLCLLPLSVADTHPEERQSSLASHVFPNFQDLHNHSYPHAFRLPSPPRFTPVSLLVSPYFLPPSSSSLLEKHKDGAD